MGALVHRLALRADPLPGRVFSLFKLQGHKYNYKDAGYEPTEVELNPNLESILVLQLQITFLSRHCHDTKARKVTQDQEVLCSNPAQFNSPRRHTS